MAGAADLPSPLTGVAEIRALPREVAAQRMPVKVRGVVTFAFQSQDNQDFVIQDAAKGIYVNVSQAKRTGILQTNDDQSKFWKRGMVLEVEGVTAPGEFAPVIFPKRILTLGTTRPPNAVSVTLPQLLTGVFDCQQVSLQGVVQRVEKSADLNQMDKVHLLVATEGGGHFTADGIDAEGFETDKLVDAAVCVRGCALPFFNLRGELIGVRVLMTDRGDLDILRPPPNDPFSAPVVGLEHLKTFSADSPNLQRQRIQGVVTLSYPAEYFYLQSGNRAVRVTSTQPEALNVGDQIEAVGFVEMSQNFAELHEAVFRKIGFTNAPAPVPMNWERATQGAEPLHELELSDFDGRLVTLKGRLARIESIPGEPPRLYLDHQGHTIIAEFENKMPSEVTGKLRLGSELEVTGICVISLATTAPTFAQIRPKGFRILMRSPADVTVLRMASWWTPQRLLGAMLIGIFLLSGSLLWAWQLQRQLNRKSRLLAIEMHARKDAAIEFKATLRERTRLAANLHDTLLQNISALNYQLEACEVESLPRSERKANYLDSARRIVQRAQQDLRGTVWALRVLPLHDQTFAEALRTLARQLVEGREVKITVAADDNLPKLSDFVAGNLLLIAQEAMHNALKHAHPSQIQAAVSVASDGKHITLTVHDNGAGFDPKVQPQPNGVHFGLDGMRERVERLVGKLRVESQPGQGTTVCAEVLLGSFDEELS